MPHKDIKVIVGIYDTVFRRCEYWCKTLDNQSRDKFYTEALLIHCNNLGKSYPEYVQGEIDYINKSNN